MQRLEQLLLPCRPLRRHPDSGRQGTQRRRGVVGKLNAGTLDVIQRAQHRCQAWRRYSRPLEPTLQGLGQDEREHHQERVGTERAVPPMSEGEHGGASGILEVAKRTLVVTLHA